jgi:hypothetical protein
MQNYFGYPPQFMYHLYVNQQIIHQQEVKARVTFEQWINDEFTSIHSEFSNLQSFVTYLEDWQHTLKTNWVNRY